MKPYRLMISVVGLSEQQARDGTPFLVEELRQRPWLLVPQVKWNGPTEHLIICLGYEAESQQYAIRAAQEEMMHCIVSTMKFDRKLTFDVAETTPL